jgi:hypothetical protein
MADNDDREIGRRVVSAVVMQRLGASRTNVGDFQVTPEQSAFAAGRTK